MVRITISSQYPEFWTAHSGYRSYNPDSLGGIWEGKSVWQSPPWFVFSRMRWFEGLMSRSIIQNLHYISMNKTRCITIFYVKTFHTFKIHTNSAAHMH